MAPGYGMMDQIEGMRQLIVPTPDQAPADLYNAESAVLQRMVGVNPDECLKVEIIASDGRTPLDLLFSGLKALKWRSPQNGEWREHDEVRVGHWGGTRILHPNSVAIVVKAATVGEQLLESGDREQIEDMAWALDYVVTSFYTRSKLTTALVLGGFKPPYYEHFRIQEAHNKAMKEAAAKLVT